MTTIIRKVTPHGDAAVSRAASVVPSSFDERDNSFEVVWSTGARRTMLRWDGWDPVEVDEELVIDRKSVRLGRLNASAPFLADHRQSVDSVVGSVVPATARLEGGHGVARVRLAETPGTAETVAKIKAGHLRNVSVGYIVHTYEVTENAGARPLYRATDWEPMEISIVPIPADAGAQIRSNEGIDMGYDTPPQLRRQLERRDFSSDRNDKALDAKLVSEATIRRRAADCQLSAEETLELLEQHEVEPFTRGALTSEVMKRWQAKDSPGVIVSHVNPDNYYREHNTDLKGRLESALYSKLARKDPAPEAREFMGASLGSMARLLLESRGERVGMMNDRQVIERSMGGLHSTSDFPELLLGAGNRFLQDSFALARSPLLKVSKIRTVGDFREIKVLQHSGFSGLEAIGEGGEFKNGTFTEGKESYKIGTFGKIFSISRNALINDDLGAFSDPLAKMARMAAECEAQQLADLLLQGSGNGPTMADGKALFHADHGNKAASGTAIDVSNLSVARQAMRNQKEVGSNAPINAAAKYLMVGAAKETQAEQVLASLSPATIDAVNPFSGKLELLVEPRFAGNSWRLFADPTLAPVIEAAYLEGHEAPTLETREGWRTLGVEFRIFFDFGCGAVDHRGAYLNAGA